MVKKKIEKQSNSISGGNFKIHKGGNILMS